MELVKLCYVGGEMMENKFMCLSPYQLAGSLRDAGFAVEVVEITPEDFEDDSHVAGLIEAEMVGFSCNSFTYPFVLPLIRKIKQSSPQTVTVMGGIHTLRSYEEIFRQSPLDYMIRGEADRSLPELARALGGDGAVEDVAGLARRGPLGVAVCNPLDYPDVNSAIPLPCYDLIPRTPPILIFETSRGCPFKCTFCSIDQSARWRAWDAPEVVERFTVSLARLKDRRGLRSVMFGDDNFATDQRRAAEILAALHAIEPQLVLAFETRAREILLNPILLKTCAEHGIRTNYLFGIECGYNEGMRRIKKNLTVDEVRRCARLLVDYKLQAGAVFSYIIGFPWESGHERLATLRFADELYQEYGIKSTCFFWLPTPSAITAEFNLELDFSIPFWWRKVQYDMHEIISDEEATLMDKVNSNGNFTDTRIDDTSRPGRSPRELPQRAEAVR